MKFVVQQEDLNVGLQNVSRAVSGRTTLPILSGVLLETNNKELKLVGTDLELSVETTVPAKIERSGAIVLSAHYLSEIVSRIPSGAIHIEVNLEQHTAELVWQKAEFLIHGSAADQFPALPSVEQEVQAAFDSDLLGELIRQTMFAVSTDESRPMLTGVQFTLQQEAAYAIATDGFRIVYRRGPLLTQDTALAEPVSLVVPGRALRELLRITGATDSSGTLAFGQSQASFEFKELRFLSRLLEGEYPNVLELIPREYGTVVTLDTQDFHDACERAVLISHDKQRSYAVKVEIEPDRVVLTSNAPDVGRAYEELAADVEGEETTVAFNGRYIIDGLKQIDTEQVRFELSGVLSPSRIQPLGHDDFFYIILPMRNA